MDFLGHERMSSLFQICKQNNRCKSHTDNNDTLCTWTGQLQELENHLKECQHNIYHQHIIVNTLINHCDMRPVDCENGQRVTLNNQESHHNDGCSLQVVCPLSNMGTTTQTLTAVS